MRLIDADELKNILTVAEYPCVLQTALVGIVDTQPTACDVDKVLEQLENERKFWENAYDSNLGKEKARSYEHAIEIVKEGGADGNT